MKRLLAIVLASITATAAAQQSSLPLQPAGTLILMTGAAEVELTNDEAVANFFYEAQDADLTRAQSSVNQRVADGTAALKRADPKAQIETSGYSSYPVYSSGSNRTITGWRVRQGVTMRTDNLAALAKTVASAQPALALGEIEFRLSKTAREKVEAQLIQLAVANLNARFAAAGQSMGVPATRIRLEEVNFGVREAAPQQPMMMRSAMQSSDAVVPPTFESGRSIERLTVTGKARFLP
ncbi:MAG TPA: SIMPL domain-containing protein [Burkholderiaceae bacterium]|nr:SIMPL domain-containing protein [Burkholderiaceae bacterium]